MDALKKKPVPEEFTEHVVKLPGQDIIFKDLTSKVKINRADILKKIKPKQTIISTPFTPSTPATPALTALPSEHSSEIPDSIQDSTQKSPSSSISHPSPGKTVYAPAPAKKLKKLSLIHI